MTELMTTLCKPTEWQERVLLIPYEHDVAMLSARGIGKTSCILWDMTRRVLERRERLAYFRSTHVGNAEVFQQAAVHFHAVIPGLRINSATRTFTCSNGSTIVFDQVGDVLDGLKHQGKSYTGLYFDEVGELADLGIVDQLRASLRAPEGHPARCVYSGNPGGRAHQQLFSRFVNGVTPWHSHIDAKTGASFVLCVGTAAQHNPHLDAAEYARNLSAACANDPDRLRAWLHGEWHINRGAYFGSVLDERGVMIDPWPEWPRPKTNRHYSFEPIMSMDWGSSAPAAIYLAARSPGGEAFGRYFSRGSLILVDELSTHRGDDYGSGCGYTVPEVADRIRDLCARWGFKYPVECAADDACFSRNGAAAGSIADEFRSCGITLYPARKAGRVAGWTKMRTLLSQASRPDVPGLHVSRLCRAWWATVPHLQRDPRNPEDVDSRSRDHWADSTRYLITSEGRRVHYLSLSGTPG